MKVEMLNYCDCHLQYVHHCRTYIRGNIKKYWFIAQMIRGMSIDEAIKQLSFHKLPVATQMRDVE